MSDGGMATGSRGMDRGRHPDLRVSLGRSSAQAAGGAGSARHDAGAYTAAGDAGFAPHSPRSLTHGATPTSAAASPLSFGDQGGLAAAVAMVAASARDEPGNAPAPPEPLSPVVGAGHGDGVSGDQSGYQSGSGGGGGGAGASINARDLADDPIAFGPSVLPQCSGVTAPWRQHMDTSRTSANDSVPSIEPQVQTVWGPNGQLQVGAPWLASPATPTAAGDTFRGSADDLEWHGDSSDDDRFERRGSFGSSVGAGNTPMFVPQANDAQPPAQPWQVASPAARDHEPRRAAAATDHTPRDRVANDVPPVLYYPPDAAVPWYPQNQQGAPEDLLRGNLNTEDEWLQRQLRQQHEHNVAHFEEAQDPFAQLPQRPRSPGRAPGSAADGHGHGHGRRGSGRERRASRRRPSRPRSPGSHGHSEARGDDSGSGGGVGGNTGAALLPGVGGGTTRRRVTRRADDSSDGDGVVLDRGPGDGDAPGRPGEVLLPDNPVAARVLSVNDALMALARVDSGATVRALQELWTTVEPDLTVDRGVDVPPCRLSAMGYFSVFVLAVYAVSSAITALGLAPEGSDDFVFAAALLVGTPTVGFVDTSLQPSMRHDIGWVLFLQLFAALPGMTAEWGARVLRTYLDPNFPFIVYVHPCPVWGRACVRTRVGVPRGGCFAR